MNNITTSSIPVEVFDHTGDPIPDRYSSEEQALRAEVERQNLVIAELVRALDDVTADMFGTVDSGDVYMHIVKPSNTGFVAVLKDKTAGAFHRAKALLDKYGVSQ